MDDVRKYATTEVLELGEMLFDTAIDAAIDNQFKVKRAMRRLWRRCVRLRMNFSWR